MSGYPKGHGALFVNDRKAKETHPEYRGNIELTSEQLAVLIQMGKSGMECKLQVAAWWRTAPNGVTYLSLSTEAYMPNSEAAAPPRGTYPQQGYQQPPQPVPQQPMAPQPQVPPHPVPQAPQPVPQAPQAPQPVPQAPVGDFNDFDQDIPF